MPYVRSILLIVVVALANSTIKGVEQYTAVDEAPLRGQHHRTYAVHVIKENDILMATVCHCMTPQHCDDTKGNIVILQQ